MSGRSLAAIVVLGLTASLARQIPAQTLQYRSPAGVEYFSTKDTGTVARAEQTLARDPSNVNLIIALGVAQAGVTQMREAITTFTKGLTVAPNNALLYRWRGHRHLSVREFAEAKADFARGLAIDSTVYGIWYHLGIVRFADGDFNGAAEAFARAQPRAPDAGELAGSTDWLWMSLSRAGRHAEAKAMLDRHPDSLVVANAYSQRLRMYRGLTTPDKLFTPADTAGVQVATLAFGLGNWYLAKGDTAKAREQFERSVQSTGWAGFGFIMSEIELRRTRGGVALKPGEKPLITPKDMQKWESLAGSRFSPDGTWLTYGITRGSEENDLRIRGGPRDTTLVVAYATQPAFTPDSRWVAYLVGIPPKERDKLLKDKKPVHTSWVARNLATGDTVAVADVAAFAFSHDGRFVSMTRYPAEGKKTQDVLVQELATGTRLAFSNVAEQSWADRRALLAFTTMVDGGTGNGVQLFDGSTGAVRVLDASTSVYRGISWRPKSEDLAVLRTKADKEFGDTAHAVLAWSGATVAGSAMRVLEANAAGLPAGVRVTDYRRPSWSRDGSTLYLGLRKREPVSEAVKKGEDKVSDVEIWHSKDVHVIPDQRSAERRDLTSTMTAAWRVGDAKVMQIGSDVSEPVSLLEGDRYATEVDRKPYAFGQSFGRRDEDIWLVDLASGSRKKMLEKMRFFSGTDPSGKRASWFDGKDYWVMDVASGTRTNLTAKLTGAQSVDFVDRDDDHPNNILPPIGNPLWAKGGSAMFVYSDYDIWQLALDGSGGKRLTDGAKEGVQYRFVTSGDFYGTSDDRGIDLKKPVYLSLYGKRTKKSGYARMTKGGDIQRLVFGDAQYGALIKADSAERYAFTKQTFDESPNVYAGGPELANAKAMSATNTFQKDYAWGKAELIDFTSTIGKPLQGILYYPANYDATKKYPMIVYTYELLSQGYHRYIVPRETDYYNANVFTQNGYFVLMPDIVFSPREPGVSVLYAVEPAVNAVIARGLVDPARIGHTGHSQGGYEAYFLATHSKLFATAVAGAGITDMISFAGQMHWSSVPEFDHWETGQFRMEVAPWEDMPAMIRNSPLDKVQVMPAKSMLMEIGGEDPTVDMRQGVEFYNYARRAGKDVVMLLYPGEGHGLGKKENAIDYERRILQWFAYYLKGEAPAKWITEGQTWVDRKRVLDANK